MSRDAACNLERCIDSMWMLTTALFGSRLQGHECKRKTAEWSSEHASVLLSLSILTYTAHSLFLHIDNTKITLDQIRTINLNQIVCGRGVVFKVSSRGFQYEPWFPVCKSNHPLHKQPFSSTPIARVTLHACFQAPNVSVGVSVTLPQQREETSNA